MRELRFSRFMAVVGWMAASAAFGAFPPTAAYPPALEDPVVDGSFTTKNEYKAASGTVGGPGKIPDGTEWVFLGWDDSMHPTPVGVVVGPVDGVPIEH